MSLRHRKVETVDPFEGFTLVAVGDCDVCGNPGAPLYESGRFYGFLICDGCILGVSA